MDLRHMRLAALLLVAASACGNDSDSDMNSMPSSMAGGGAEEAGPGQFEEDFQDSDEFFTQMDGLVLGMSPHRWQQTWYSMNLADMVDEDHFTAPVGAVAIKEFASAEDEPIGGYAVMVKREAGYDPDNNDWHYEMRDPDGELKDMPEPGPIPDCIACHEQFADTDYLGATKVR